MDSIGEIVGDLKYSRAQLLAAINGLSARELTKIPVYAGWTVKDVLAHIAGWDRRTLQIIPLIASDRASQVTGIDVQNHNRRAVANAAALTFAEVLAQVEEVHRQVINLITGLDYKEIDRRHERNGRIITIRSYVIDIMAEHERQHAAEIELWRANLDRAIDPAALVAALHRQRALFLAALERFQLDAHLSDRAAVGVWSVSDVVGHLADWERVMLKAARHIHDPSLPAALPVAATTTAANDILAARRQDKSWAENYADLLAVHAEVDAFIAALTPGDWRLRGPYPWPNDRGTLAELISHITEHYTDHTPEVEAWHQKVSK